MESVLLVKVMLISNRVVPVLQTTYIALFSYIPGLSVQQNLLFLFPLSPYPSSSLSRISFIMYIRISLTKTIPPLSLYAPLTSSCLNHSFSFTRSNHTGPRRYVLHDSLSTDLEAMSFYLSLIIQEKKSVAAKREEMALNYRL